MTFEPHNIRKVKGAGPFKVTVSYGDNVSGYNMDVWVCSCGEKSSEFDFVGWPANHEHEVLWAERNSPPSGKHFG